MVGRSRSPQPQRDRYRSEQDKYYADLPSRQGRYQVEDASGKDWRDDSDSRHQYSDRQHRNRESDRASRGHRRDRASRFGEREEQRSSPRQRPRDNDEARRSSRRSPSPPSHSERRSESPKTKGRPNFAPSGLLAAATNTVKISNGDSVLLKYNEPPEARKPSLGWRLYVFKGSEQVELLHIHRQSAYLIGRDRTVADIPVEHPSCSKQHAVIQYRHVQVKDEFGTSKGTVKPFIIDLESTNGTYVNDEAVPVSRYFELKPSDVIKFGQSTREYVFLHDETQ